MKRLILLLVLMAIAGTVLGVDAPRPVFFPDSIGLDSVRILQYKNTVLYDSISDSISTFPFTGDVTIDDQNHWRLKYFLYFHASSTPITFDEIVWGKADTISPSSPASINLCNVYTTITDAANNPVRNADVTYTLPTKVYYNTCDSTLITTNIVTDRTNAAGLVETDLIKSTCIGNKKWSMTVTYKDAAGTVYTMIENKPITVPDASSYEVVF